MGSHIAVELGPVQETLLIPLLGRAEATKQEPELLYDAKAVEIVEALDYDFGKWDGVYGIIGPAIRTRIFDEGVRAFLEAHPQGTVIEIGAGLNTRYERLDNGRAHWIELDLPDSMALRRQFFEDTARRTMIAASVLETDWHAQVLAQPAPYCFVSEAVIIYLDEAEVRRCIAGLARSFPDALLITDTTSSSNVDAQSKSKLMNVLSRDAWFRWRCDDPGALGDWGAALESSRTILDAPPHLLKALPLPMYLVMRYLPFLIRPMIGGYRINHFRLSAVGGT